MGQHASRSPLRPLATPLRKQTHVTLCARTTARLDERHARVHHARERDEDAGGEDDVEIVFGDATPRRRGRPRGRGDGRGDWDQEDARGYQGGGERKLVDAAIL